MTQRAWLIDQYILGTIPKPLTFFKNSLYHLIKISTFSMKVPNRKCRFIFSVYSLFRWTLSIRVIHKWIIENVCVCARGTRVTQPFWKWSATFFFASLSQPNTIYSSHIDILMKWYWYYCALLAFGLWLSIKCHRFMLSLSFCTLCVRRFD